MKKYSTRNKCKCSDGSSMSRAELERKIRLAKQSVSMQQFDHFDYNFCMKCGISSGVYLDHAHVVSVKECIESGKSELAADPKNIRIYCRDCHRQHDNNFIHPVAKIDEICDNCGGKLTKVRPGKYQCDNCGM